ncbi:putative Eukaryotic translation initiation factor 3 subunit J [Sclerotinia borealis F-4128]|uniref:Eukaryotic translation initiation factor 3 subunit J n=1 Tax=Sclerotinia borealis (strain F-4128) TaxID=1432307 RepID=W9CPZ4_SCLBF|nr:putative Eukaryotic translation initiation factor 3 subunit J [Sclerotinia borealis F-4128]
MPDKWDEESSSEESPEPTPAQNTSSNRRKFDDEEDDDEVLDSWSAAEDSEVEREKAKVETERKAKADALAAANKKSKAQRVAEKQAERARELADGSDESSEEDEASRRERLRRTEQDSDLKHAEDLFGNIGINSRKDTSAANAVQIDEKNPAATVDLTTLPLFDPRTKPQFEKLRETLVPLIANNAKKAQYTIFLQEFTKQISKDLPSDQIKKIASTLTALGNEKMKEEKAAEKGGKKSKAQKTKTTLNTSRNMTSNTDTQAYNEDFGE